MKFYKVFNFTKENGKADYKGLNTNLFKFDSQQIDWVNNLCVIATHEDTEITHTELVELTEAQYIEIRDVIKSDNNQENNPSELDILKQENLELKLALAEMAEKQEVAQLETQLAMAELAEAVMGGVK